MQPRPRPADATLLIALSRRGLLVHFRRCLFVVLIVGIVEVSSAAESAPPAAAEVYARTVRPFLAQHCFTCHGEKDRKAGLRLDDLGHDFLAGKTADVWKEVIDRINLGDMPPEEKPRPDAKQAFEVVEWVGRELKRAEREARMSGGRILARRLNRSEYANTIRDLLHLDANFTQLIEDELPGDGKAEGFDRIGSALLFDQTQLTTYIEQAAVIAAKAIVDVDARPQPMVTRREFEKQWRKPRDGDEVIQYQKDTAIPGGPTADLLRDEGVEFYNINSSSYVEGFGGFGSLYSFNLLKDAAVPQDGYYRIRLRAGAFAGSRNLPIQFEFVYLPNMPGEKRIRIPVQGTLAEPQTVETIVFLQRPADGASPRVQMNWNGLNDVIIQTPELAKINNRRNSAGSKIAKLLAAKAPQAEIEAAKAESDALIAEARAFSQKPGAATRVHNDKYRLEEVPRIFMDWVEFEGPIEPEWPPRSHTSLFPDGLPGDDAVRAAFARWLPRAYRRPATEAEVEQLVGVVRRSMAEFEMTRVEALRYALQTALSSPDFLMLFEPSTSATSRPLNDYELAARLSYFLWSTMPDDELFTLAATGKLREASELERQVKRMLADAKAREFVENFAGQWLHVREFGSVTPARDYQDYDTALAAAEREEPYAFFEEVLRNDLSILNFLDSDFATVNARLAKFYGIEGVEGDAFRRVPLDAEHRRGGVLTMAGLLTLLADGTRTLPVRRGAWILEEIFNDPPPPPPPNAGEIQPNASGARLTVRERLERHRNEATCASCHAKIDPLGLALENYDAIGAWRERQNGEGIKGPKAPPIDASGTLDGRTFTGPAEFKQALLAEKDRFARAFAEKLLTYALGRPVGYIDHATLDRCTEALVRHDYRLQALVTAIVTSEPFRTK
jgi:mono/diheme cytochrome c family protein